MGLECGWRHARKRWSREFEDFEKESVEIGPLRQELGIRPLRVEFWPLKDVVEIYGSLPTGILNITSWGGVSIERIVSFSSCRHEPRSTWNNRVRLCFVFVYVYVYSCDWYHYGYGIQQLIMLYNHICSLIVTFCNCSSKASNIR